MSSTSERRIEFLRHCLEQLDEQVCKARDDRRDFLGACLHYLQDNEKLTSEALSELGAKHTAVQEKALRNWIKAFRDALEEQKHRLSLDLHEYELTKFPRLVEHTGGGSGVRTYYQIDVDAEVESEAYTVHEAQMPLSPPITETRAHSDGLITYHTEQLKRAPWYLRLGNVCLRSLKSRIIFFLLALLIVYLALPVPLVTLYLLNPSETYLVAIFAVLLAIYLIISGPTTKLIKLIHRKIVVIDDIRSPLSAVCISEIAKLPAEGEAANRVLRRLSVVVVSADCPICSRIHGLRKSVYLEQHILFGGPILGICSNNPMMHRYSFDKDLMTGERLSPRIR